MTLAYDGTEFHGWQIQPGLRSVQQELEAALSSFGSAESSVIASGRTDAGVHAIGQKAHFDYSGSMDEKHLLLAFRTKLPQDIDVTDIIKVPQGFHARFAAHEREYRYLLCTRRTPFNRNYMGFIPRVAIDPQKMRGLCKILTGKHDFSSFGKPNPDVPNRVCDLRELSFVEKEDHYEFRLVADRFLHNMVRRIVGTLASFSGSNTDPSVLRSILQQQDPRQTLVLTAPACGLYLYRVAYPHIGLD